MRPSGCLVPGPRLKETSLRRLILPTSASLIAGLLIACGAGCGTVKTSGTVRTATEQLLLTNAWDSALAQVDFRPLAGKTVFFAPQHVSAVDQGWAVSSIRAAMATQGQELGRRAWRSRA